MEPNRPDQQTRGRRAATPYLRRIITEFYRTTLEDYEKAGCPFGDRVDGMLVWYEFGQETRRN